MSLGFDQSSRIFYDKCSQTYRDRVNGDAGNYSFQPFPSQHPAKAVELSLEQPNVHAIPAKGSAGYEGSLVDIDSHLRNAPTMTHMGETRQLLHHTHFNVPYLARGPGNACVESALRPGEDVGQPRSGNVLAQEDVTEYRFHPLIQSVQKAQDPTHIIPEDNRKDWVRGGQSSRELLRKPEVLQRMGYRHNGKFWQKPCSANPN